MPLALLLLLGVFLNGARSQESQPLEAKTSPFDFDNYRRTPLQARQTSTTWASRNNNDLQRGLISGDRGREENIAARAAALFPDPEEIPTRQEPEPLPTPQELTDEIATANYGETTKGPRDLLARGRVANRLNLSTMSTAEYDLYVARYRAEQGSASPVSGDGLLRPMPTLNNSKTGGPPHAYAVSQAGVGTRTEARDAQNPFEGLMQVLRLDQPVTKGTDPLPTPSARLAVATPAPTPASPPATNPVQTETAETQP